MAGIADLLISSALQHSTDTPDLAGNFSKGAQLGLEVEKTQQARAALEQKKQEQELAKFSKVGEWFDTASKMPDGAAKKAFVKNFIPNGIKALGVQDRISPTVMEMLSGDSQLASFLKHKIETGDLDMGVLSRDEDVAKLAASPEYAQFGGAEAIKQTVDAERAKLEKAQETRTQQEATKENAQITAQGQMNRQIQEQGAQGGVELAKQVNKKYADYTTAGGHASMQSAIDGLKAASKALDTGEVTTGGVTTKIPGFNSDSVQTMLNPKMVEMKTQAQSALNAVLRQTLGAQFTEQEGLRVLNQVWDDKQSPAVNKRKLDRKIKELETGVKDMEAQFSQYVPGYKAQQKATKPFKTLSSAAQKIVIQTLMDREKISEAEARKKLEGN